MHIAHAACLIFVLNRTRAPNATQLIPKTHEPCLVVVARAAELLDAVDDILARRLGQCQRPQWPSLNAASAAIRCRAETVKMPIAAAQQQHCGARHAGLPTFSHFWHSESQLPTREVGHTMMMCLATGLPPNSGCPELSSVHSSAMPCSVLPSPMSSARMQPATKQCSEAELHSLVSRMQVPRVKHQEDDDSRCMHACMRAARYNTIS
jgi:hypothetical protein